MANKLFRYEVSHPELGTVIVESISAESAIADAAEQWGERWTEIAWECSTRKLGTAKRPRCRRCSKEFGVAGDTAVYCSDCLQVMERQRWEARAFARRDTRAGMRE